MAQNTPPKAQNIRPKAESTPLKSPINGSASKPLKLEDPGFVNPYINYVAEFDPSGTMDDGRSYVGRMSHYVDKSPFKATRDSTNKSQTLRQTQRRAPQPMPNLRSSGRNPTPQTNGKQSRYSTAQSGREYQQSRWSGQPLATSSKLPEGFFGTAKGTTSMPAPPTTASITNASKNTRRSNRGDGWGGIQEGEGCGETRGRDSRDGWEESQQQALAAWKTRHKPIPTAELADIFFGTPKDVSTKAPTPEAHLRSRTSRTDELSQMQWGTPQVNRAKSDHYGHESVDQMKDHLGTSGWFTNPAFDRKDRPAQQPQPQPQAPPSSSGIRPGEREFVKEQELPPGQKPARLPDPTCRSEEATRPRDVTSVPPCPISQEGDPLLIQYPVGDGCWVKMVVYVERDSKTAYSRLAGIGRRQISGVKVKTPEQLGEMVKDVIIDEKKNLLG
ncbi:hypothetical protein BGZ93_010189 [Podila epicladia]|nr:hypothetical protein BGZ92_003574 [Podila epicladia]KAG0100596.1 hypothetical protein BGZ93_010189 [Podila epicladia]